MPLGLTRIVTALRVIAALVSTVFNLIPLYGIRVWAWDPFQIVLLYWAETAILVVCTLIHLACIPFAEVTMTFKDDQTAPVSRGTIVGFFALHSSAFACLHLYFLCTLFAGNALREVHSVADFIIIFFIDTGAWAPLALLVLAGIIDVLTGEYHPAFVDAFARWVHITLGRPPLDEPGEIVVSDVVSGLYVRIIIIGLAIIVGNQHAQQYGSFAPLFIVIVLKTLVDLAIRLGPILKGATAYSPALVSLIGRVSRIYEFG